VRATLLAAAAAATFGVALYAAGRVARDLPLAVAIVPARIAGVVALLIPLAVLGRLRLSRRALPLVVLTGLCEIAGLAAFTLGARHGIAVAAVLGSQFAAFAAVAAFLLFRERLSRLQLAGVVAIVAGVAVLSAVRR
jgi:drug/metabolite transporter (DMT)-like permease